MKILHYALGFPPYRTGGLTKYCIDLMLTQIEKGDSVALLWPGEIRTYGGRVSIKKRKAWKNVGSYEIINPLPVALDEGIMEIQAFMKKSDKEVFLDFFRKRKPDIIHIHTLMGLYQEVIEAANELGIRTVFTTHDYYGLCPKVTFYYNGNVCTDDHGCIDCARCNQTALSLKKIAILQSALYRTAKDTALVKMLRKKHRAAYFEEKDLSEVDPYFSRNKAKEYRALRGYYCSILDKIDCIHYNSTVAKAVYEKYINPSKSNVISITHRDIRDHRHEKTFDTDKLKITYLGPAKAFKGFNFILSVLDKIWKSGEKRFELHLYSKTTEKKAYISHMQDGYKYEELEGIFEDTDVLVVPSQWNETFGFTVLEALSYGVPVITSNKVGASDLIRRNTVGIICNNDEMYECISSLCKNRSPLFKWNKEIQNLKFSEITDVNQCYEY